MYAIDSNIFISFLRGQLPLGLELLQSMDPRTIIVPSVVKAELLLGVEKSIDKERGRKAVDQLLAPFEIADFDGPAAECYAGIRRSLEQAGQRIGANDMMIAAICLSRNATLITNNEKEFQRVPGLKVESWKEVDLPSNAEIAH